MVSWARNISRLASTTRTRGAPPVCGYDIMSNLQHFAVGWYDTNRRRTPRVQISQAHPCDQWRTPRVRMWHHEYVVVGWYDMNHRRTFREAHPPCANVTFRAADPLIGTKFPNPHLKTKCGFKIQIQNIKIPNANTKRENSNLDSELDAKIIVSWKGFPQFVLQLN